jgi:hypothetical protein
MSAGAISKAVLTKGDKPVTTIESEGLIHADVLAEVCQHQP